MYDTYRHLNRDRDGKKDRKRRGEIRQKKKKRKKERTGKVALNIHFNYFIFFIIDQK